MLPATKSVLSVKPKAALADFLKRLQRLGVANVNEIGDVARTTIACIKASGAMQQELNLGKLMQRWYASLQTGTPDYSVYSSSLYLAELWACWSIYSRKYLLSLTPERSLPPVGIAKAIAPVSRIVDLGCGCGYTAAGFRELFPAAEVVGTNISGSIQYKVACGMAAEHGFSMVPTVQDAAGKTSLVFASEYFEHIHAPIDHLREVLSCLRPRFLLVANAFGTTAIGHFHTYRVDGAEVIGVAMRALFDKEMKRLGYVRIKTRLWNNRPAFWARKAA